MVLATHAVIGTAAAAVFRSNPVTAFLAAFLSHFAADAVPHWHYRILSKKDDPGVPFGERLTFDAALLKDLIRTGLDCLLGLVISTAAIYYVAPSRLDVALIGTVGGVLPDFLQLLYYRFPNNRILYALQRFHHAVHAKQRLDDQPFFGIGTQAAIGFLFVLVIGSLQ